MILTVVTSSTDEQLASTDAVRKLVGLTTDETSDDARISTLISQASRWAETYIGRPLSAASYRVALSGYGSRRMLLGRYPVRAVSSLWNATDTGSATTILSSGFKVDREAGTIERDAGFAWDASGVPRPFAFPLAGSAWPGEERAPWLADFVAGYTYAGIDTGSDNYSTAGPGGTTSTGRTLPEDIEDAVARRAADIYDGNVGVIEERVGDLGVKYATVGGQPIDQAAQLLDAYRTYV